LRELAQPPVVTLHTVLSEPTPPPIAFDPIDPFYDQRASDSINSIGSSVARHGRPARVCVHR